MTSGAESTPARDAAERAVAAALETAAGDRRGAEAGAAAVPRGLVALPRRTDRDGVRPLPGRYVVSAAFNPVPSLSTASVIPERRHARQLPRDPVRPAGALPELVPQHDDRRDRDRGRDRPPGRARRVRVLALPLQGPPVRDALAPPDPDVPAVPRRRRDLPDHAQPLRRLPRHRAQHAHRPDARLPRRRARDQRVAPGRLLQLDPGRARRVGPGRRRDPGADLLGRHPPARRARARRDRAALVRLDAERVHHRLPAPAGPRQVHALGRAVRLHLRPVRAGMGAVLRRRRARRPARRAASSSSSSAGSSAGSPRAR